MHGYELHELDFYIVCCERVRSGREHRLLSDVMWVWVSESAALV